MARLMESGKSYCLVQDVMGPLQIWSKRDWNRVAKAWHFDDGSSPTGDQLKTHYLERLSQGWEVLPLGKCDRHDKVKGCLGHPIKQGDE